MNDQIQKNVNAIAELEKNIEAHRSRSERIGSAIAGLVGTMRFAVSHIAGISLWVYMNRMNSPWQFDPYPWPILILALEVEAIVLSSFVLMTQRHQTRVADRRSHLNLQISMLAEAEMTKVMNTLRTIAVHLGLPDEGADKSFREMAEDTNVEHVAKALDDQLTEDTVKTDTTPGQSSPASH
jgi:uncharacterized membrane protein